MSAIDDIQVTTTGTLSNPDAFRTVKDLRRELHYANARIFDLVGHQEQALRINRYLSARLVNLIQAHLANDQERLHAELEELSGHYRRELETKGHH